jgi:large subunit ribosomal protein L29
MEMRELLDMAPEELHLEEKKLRKELFHIRFQLMTGRAENQMRVRQIRRDIARVQTVYRQKNKALTN